MHLFIQYLNIFFTFSLLIFSCSPQKSTSDKPNILWIVANDLGTDVGCYGNSLVNTPNIDRLAREGVRYQNFYTVASTCQPSRSAFITGMYPVSIGAQNQWTQFKDSLPNPVVPVTKYFKEAGYFVANSGTEFNKKSMGKTGYAFIHDPGEMYDGYDWRQKAPGQPFFSQIQLSLPHRPFKHDSINPIAPEKVELPPYYPDRPVARHDWAMYLETIQLLDKKVGKILKRLENDGYAENTAVFLFSDHGRPHVRAKQFLYDGGIQTPLIVRWPGQLNSGTTNNRLVSNIDLAPTAMTLAGIDVPGYMQGRDFLGNSSKPREYIFAMRDRSDGTLDRIRAVRTQNFKYIRNFYPDRPYTQFNAYKKWAYPVLTLMQVMKDNNELTAEQSHFMARNRPAEELYDLRRDPFEVNNLANQKDYQDQLIELRGVLDNWLKKADQGEYPEDSAEIKYAKELMHREFKEHMKRKGLSVDISNEEYLKYWQDVLVND